MFKVCCLFLSVAITIVLPQVLGFQRVHNFPLNQGQSCFFREFEGARKITYNLTFVFKGIALDENSFWNHTTTCENLPNYIKKTRSTPFISSFNYPSYNDSLTTDTDWEHLAQECLRWTSNTDILKSALALKKTYYCSTTRLGSEPLHIQIKRLNFVLIVYKTRYNSENLIIDSTQHTWYIPFNVLITCRLGTKQLKNANEQGTVYNGGCFDSSQDHQNSDSTII